MKMNGSLKHFIQLDPLLTHSHYTLQMGPGQGKSNMGPGQLSLCRLDLGAWCMHMYHL